MPPQGYHWRLMTGLDMPDVGAIADIVHPAFPEDIAVLAEKQRLHPDGARLLDIGGHPAGYLLSHPWPADRIPPLNRRLGALPEGSTSYYIHDLALLPAARRSGAAGAVVASIARHARDLGHAQMALCAVNGSIGFWERQGFAVRDVPTLAAELGAYADDARYMTRLL